MLNKGSRPSGPVRNWGFIGAVAAAVAASACCVVPLLLVALGVGGAWAGALTSLEPYRPIFVGLAVAALGFALFREHRTSTDPECDCESPVKDRTRRVLLGLGVVAVLGLLAAPWIISVASERNATQDLRAASAVQSVTLELENMTCASCEVTVRKSLESLGGIRHVEVTSTPPRAIVVYDAARVTLSDVIEATTNAGYPSRACCAQK